MFPKLNLGKLLKVKLIIYSDGFSLTGVVMDLCNNMSSIVHKDRGSPKLM